MPKTHKKQWENIGAALVMDGKIWYGAVARTDTEALVKAVELYEKARKHGFR